MRAPFTRSSDRYGDSGPKETPYLRAGREWDLRIGAQAVQAHSWRLMAFGALGAAGLAIGGLIYQASTRSIATYVVPIDQYGRPGRIELAGQTYRPSAAEIGYFLADFVTRTRAKSIDPIVIRDNWTSAYHFVAGPAIGELNAYAKANDPFARAGAEAITVEVIAVLQRSASTYQVQWRETTVDQGGASDAKTWTGLFTVKVQPPKTEAELRINPLGVYVVQFQWSREL